MAGGKETPRQKMIGMMYLVLTALLALNVSKQILDAFVAIEENIQRSSETQLIRAEGDIAFITNALAEAKMEAQKDTSGNSNAVVNEIQGYLDIINNIDAEAGKIIKAIDEAKIHILKLAGEPVDNVADKDEKAIVWIPYDEAKPCQPARLNLMAINGKDNFDIPMHELVGSDVKAINESALGMPIWNMYKEFRKNIVEFAGTYEKSGDKFVVKTEMIDAFEDYTDLRNKVRAMLFAEGNNINPKDTSMLKDIYMSLTKKEIDKHHELEGVHWLGRTFDHAPMVGALASLSTIQYEVLSARAKATSLLASRCNSGKYSFDMVQGMAFVNTGVVSPGDQFELTLFAGAFNSTKKPIIKGQNWEGELISDEKGQAVYRVKATGSGDMELTGKIGINAGGRTEFMDYKTKITVAKGEGAVEMPEYNILYMNYNNFMVASGCIEPTIQASGCSVSRTTKNGRSGFFVKPNARGPVSVRISGKDAQGAAVSFGPFKYEAKPFPDPVIVTKTIGSGGGTIQAAMPQSSPLQANIAVESIIVLGIDNGSCRGSRITGDKLRSFRRGTTIGIQVTCKNQLTGGKSTITGAVKIQ